MTDTENNFHFPERLTQDHRNNFMEMRWIFRRTIKDYHDCRINNWFPENWTKVYLTDKLWEKRKADYFYKRNNIAYAYDGKDVYHVTSWWTFLWKKNDLSWIKDYEWVFLIDRFES